MLARNLPFLEVVRHGCTGLAVMKAPKLSIWVFLWEGSRTVGSEVPLDNIYLPLLGLGLPNPALQALCKLITASETGEQLISRVSRARTAEPRLEGAMPS